MEFRLITQQSEIGLFNEAWETAFNRRYGVAFFNWLFRRHNQMYAIFDAGKVVAGYCLLPYQTVFQREVVTGALCNNVFVIPEYQKKNVFAKLGDFAVAKSAETGIKVMIGFPNQNAVFGQQAIGWTILEKIKFLEKKAPLPQGVAVSPRIKRVDTSNLTIYLPEIERLSLEQAKQRSFSVIKMQEFVKWRFFERVGFSYKVYVYEENRQVKGYIVYKYYEPFKRMHILDVEAQDQTIFEQLIDLAASFTEDFELLNLWGSSSYKENFLEAGFQVSQEASYLMAICPGNEKNISLGNQFNIVLGDNEVF